MHNGGITQDEAQRFFEEEANRCLGLSGRVFAEQYDSGAWPDPDVVPFVTYLQSLREFAA